MPLTLTLTEGVLPKGSERTALVKIGEAFLKWHKLTGNKVMTPNVVGSIHVLPLANTFAGPNETPVAVIEWKVPSFAFSTREIQLGSFAEFTEIIHDLSGGKQPKDKIFINVVYAVDGAWNMNGVAMTNTEFGATIAKG